MIRFRGFILILLLFCFSFPHSAAAQNSATELFLVAQKAFEDGFYDVAIRYVQQLQEQFPDNQKSVEAQLLLGQCYFFKSQYLKAYDIFQKLLNQDTYKDVTLFWLGETNLKGADYTQAKKQYKQLLDLFPNSAYVPQAMYSLGWAHFQQNEYAKARQTFSDLVKRFPKHQLAEDALFKVGECYYQQKKYEEAIKSFTQYIQKYPDSSQHADAFFYIAESYYYKDDPLNAVTYYANTADQTHDSKLALMAKISLGWCYLKLERFQLSQKAFDDALAFAKKKGILSDDVFLGQANLYTATKDYKKALKAYTDLITNFPKSNRLAESLLGKANILYKLNRYDEAIAVYQQIIDTFAQDATHEDVFEKAYFGMAWSYLKYGKTDIAVQKFEAIKEKTKNTTVKISALTQIGDAYQDAGNYEKAVEMYDQILQTYPDSFYTDYVQYRQGIALLKMGKLSAAKLSFQSLKNNFPDSKYVHDINYYLAVAYYQNSNWALARDTIEEFINSESTQQEFLADAYNILGLSYFYLKNYDDAMGAFKKIIKDFPGDTEAVRAAELNTAKCYYEKKDTSEALKRFKLMVEKYPSDRATQEAYIWLGDHYLKTGDYNPALVYYKQFVDTFPGSDQRASVLYEMGQAYEGLEQYEHAIEMFKQITQKENKEMYVKAKLAIADIFSRELDPNSAIQIYQNIIKSSPEFKRDAYVKIAQVYKTNQNYAQAITAYKTAIGLTAKMSLFEDAQLYFELGDTYELAKNSDRAVETYLKIGYLFPKETSWIIKAYLRMARIFENQEDWDQAKIAYEKINSYDTPERKFAQERLEWIKENIK